MRVLIALVTASVCMTGVLIIYLIFDSEATKDYWAADSQPQADGSYHEKFERLVTDVESGGTTGIKSYDDSGVVYGIEIPVTPGSGDWSSFPSGARTSTKSCAFINKASFDYNKTASPELDQTIYNPFFLEQCTVYEPHGVVKFLDRYILVATGTYLSYKIGLDAENDRGNLYRVTTDKGITYDIIVVDTKGDGATNNVLKTPGYNKYGFVTLGHPKGNNNFCLTEFYRLCCWENSSYGSPKYYPYREVSRMGSNIDNGIDYPNTMTFKKDDFGLPWQGPTAKQNYLQVTDFPAFSGNVIKFQQIIDPEATRIWNEVTAKYYDEGYAGKAVIYDKGGVICTHK